MANTRTKVKMPNLSNATPGALADWLGETRESIAELKKLEGYYKQALSARVEGQHPITVQGERFGATVTDRERESLDTTRLKAELDPEVWDPYLKTTEYEEIRTSRLSNGVDK